jgi:hypothetical protein
MLSFTSSVQKHIVEITLTILTVTVHISAGLIVSALAITIFPVAIVVTLMFYYVSYLKLEL